MALALVFTVFALMFIGSIAGVAYVAIAAGAAAGAGFVALAAAALLIPFLFVLMIFGLIRAGFCPARASRSHYGQGGPRMSGEWRGAPHEPGTAGKGES